MHLSQSSRVQESNVNTQSQMSVDPVSSKSSQKSTTSSSAHSTSRTQVAPVGENTELRTEKRTSNDANPSTVTNGHTDQHAQIYTFQRTSRFIPRCYDLIEKDQKLLLDCEDSWFDVSQNKARIPEKVLQDQIRFHESQAALQVSANSDESGQENDSDAHTEGSVDNSEDDHADNQASNEENASQHVPSIASTFGKGCHPLQSKILVEDTTADLGQDYNSGSCQRSSQNTASTQESDAAHIDHSESTDAESDYSQPSPAVNSRARNQVTTPETLSPVNNQLPSSPLSHTNAMPTSANESKPKDCIITDPLESDSFRKRMVESPASSVTTPKRLRATAGSKEAIHRPLFSSQTDEEDLELDIPHALGEKVHGSSPTHGTSLQISSQQLSTRVSHSELLIQVEKTPSQKKRNNREPSTEAFIPGTYSNSQPCPMEDESKRADTVVTSQSTNADFHESATPLPLVPSTMAQKIQDAGSTDKTSSSIQISRSRLNKSPTPNITEQSVLVFQAPSPSSIPNFDGEGDILPTSNQQPQLRTPPRAANVPKERVDNGEQPRKRRNVKDLAALGFSQDDVQIIDRDQMVRASRREILRRLSSIDPEDVLTSKECSKSPVVAEHQKSPTSIDSRASDKRREHSPGLENNQVVSLDLTTAQISEPVATDGVNPDANSQAEGIQSTLYMEYYRAYPNYKGTEKQFVKALVYLEWLGASRRPHESLLDDFVRCYAQDYSDYLRHGNAERLTGMEFYNKLREVDMDYFHPKPSGRILTAGRLESALADGSLDCNLVETWRQKYNMTSRPSPRPSPIHSSKELVTMEEGTDHQTSLDETATIATHASTTDDLEIPKKAVSRRFFETHSQVAAQGSRKDEEGSAINPVGVDIPSLRKKRRSLPWKGRGETPNISNPLNASSQSNHAKAVDDRPISRMESSPVFASEESAIDLTSPTPSMHDPERPSKTPLGRSISQPPTSRPRPKAPPDVQRDVKEVLKHQVQPSRVEKSRTRTPRSSMLPPSFSLGKLLAKTRKKCSGVLSKTTPMSSFSTSPISSSVNDASPK
ncbi:hypothetical protein ACMFMG_001836 [Clarireedia jacksonii]